HSLPGYCQPTQQHYWYDENRGVHFRAMLQLIPADGTVQNDGIQGLMVKDCTDLTVVMAMATSFNGFDKDPVKEGRPYKEIAASRLEKAKCLAWEKLMANHVADYQRLFNRVRIDLGKT
ncbi:glycoside hydrolase family 95 protein, partial [Parabacteroides distasonis]